MTLRTAQIAGTNAERTKAHNRRVVLGYLQNRDGAGRAEIARTSGLSTQTVSNIVAELEAEGLVTPAGRRRPTRGQPPLLYTCNPDGAASIGFEVRPDALLMALVNLGGSVLASRRVPLASSAPGPVMALMHELTQATLVETGISPDRLLGAGLVIPGPFGGRGLGSAGATELRGWEEMDVAASASAALGIPVLLEKDALAAAVAEGLRGVAQGMESFCYLYFGAGIGLGVMSSGTLLQGAFGNAGEIGHVVVEPGGLPCNCGKHGCLEQYASRVALQRTLSLPEPADSEKLLKLFHAGDPKLLAWTGQAARALSRAVDLLENIFDPETIILGGAMPDAVLDALIDQIPLQQGSVSNRPDRTAPRVMRGSSGRMTAALGGAALVIHDTVTPRFEKTPG